MCKNTSTKTSEMSVGSDNINVEFFGANIQFDWLETSLTYDKSDKHTTIYDSYNAELSKNNKKQKTWKFYRNLLLN